MRQPGFETHSKQWTVIGNIEGSNIRFSGSVSIGFVSSWQNPSFFKQWVPKPINFWNIPTFWWKTFKIGVGILEQHLWTYQIKFLTETLRLKRRRRKFSRLFVITHACTYACDVRSLGSFLENFVQKLVIAYILNKVLSLGGWFRFYRTHTFCDLGVSTQSFW